AKWRACHGKGIFDKVEDNAAIKIWSEKIQQEKDLAQHWNPVYSCFTFEKVGLMVTVEEYTTLLRFPRIQIGFDLGTPRYEEKGLRLHFEVMPVPTILAETFRSLSAYQRAGEERFIECAQLLLAWFHSHIWKVKKVSYRVFSEDYSSLKKFVATLRRDNIFEEKWMTILQSLQNEDIKWRSHWMIPDEILYKCEDFDWYRSRHFIPAMEGLARCRFAYKGDNCKKKGKRVNDNVLSSSQENTQSIEEHLKGKNKVEEDLDSLKMDYKKLHLSITIAKFGKTSEQWRQEIQEEKIRADQWEKNSKLLETNNKYWKEQLQRSQGQLRDRNRIISEAVTQVREVADHLQTLAVQANILSLRYESELDQG
ncbi:hypothetical protein Goklo_027810, partial [Gossypium klotzschianum]|nr:hypothetical protein [Gossypium klotzschianum]